MKEIEAVIDQSQLQEVRDAIAGLGIEEVMESRVACRQQGEPMRFRGATLMATIVEKVRLEIVAADEMVDRISAAISAIAKNGHPEGCRIAIRPYL